MHKMKKGVLALAAIGGAAIFSASASSAMPVSKAGMATSSADIQQARWGWHRHHGWHRGWGWHHRGWHRRGWHSIVGERDVEFR